MGNGIFFSHSCTAWGRKQYFMSNARCRGGRLGFEKSLSLSGTSNNRVGYKFNAIPTTGQKKLLREPHVCGLLMAGEGQ